MGGGGRWKVWGDGAVGGADLQRQDPGGERAHVVFLVLACVWRPGVDDGGLGAGGCREGGGGCESGWGYRQGCAVILR